jgi:hypothetical protein
MAINTTNKMFHNLLMGTYIYIKKLILLGLVPFSSG